MQTHLEIAHIQQPTTMRKTNKRSSKQKTHTINQYVQDTIELLEESQTDLSSMLLYIKRKLQDLRQNAADHRPPVVERRRANATTAPRPMLTMIHRFNLDTDR